MDTNFGKSLLVVLRGLQTVAVFTLLILSAAMVICTLLAAVGVMPWISLETRFGDTVVANAGIYFQVGMTLLVVGLCAFLPTHGRILQLERSHRQFSMNMNDVARAYHICHKSDRQGIFKLSDEFDAVRERLIHLREHPELSMLEPEILQAAAQMSFQSRDLAQVYSEEKVARAKGFLEQRQAEVEEMQDRIEAARHTCADLKLWLVDVEADERAMHAQLQRLEEDLLEILPTLGYELDGDPNVVKLSHKKSEAGKSSLN